MGIVDTALNILTVGGHNQAQEAYSEYKICYKEYEKIFKAAQSKQNEIEHETKKVGDAIASIVETLKQSNKILEIYEESMPLSLKEERYHKEIVSDINKLTQIAS